MIMWIAQLENAKPFAQLHVAEVIKEKLAIPEQPGDGSHHKIHR